MPLGISTCSGEINRLQKPMQIEPWEKVVREETSGKKRDKLRRDFGPQ